MATCLWWQVLARQVLGNEKKVSVEENKDVLRRWIEAFKERDLQAEAELLAPDYVAHVPAPPGPLDLEGLEAWRAFTGSFVEAFPDLRLTIKDIMAEGDTVAARGLPWHPPRRVPGSTGSRSTFSG